MTDTTFIDRDATTPIVAAWLNDVNVTVYQALGALGVPPITPTEVRTNIDAVSASALAATGGAALVGTIANETGATARTVETKLRDWLSVKDFGALGDGTTDDSAAIQLALTAASGQSLFFPAGVYRVGTTLVIKTHTALIGEGINKSILKLTAGASASISLIRNDVITGTANVYYDTDITLFGLTFDGNGNSTRTVELLNFAKIRNLHIEACSVQNATFIGIAASAGVNTIITKCLFTGIGRPIPSTVSSPAIWMDTTAQGTPYDVKIEQNYFCSNNWSAAYFMPVRGSFSNNICRSNGESTVFSNQNGQYLRYENNTITGTTMSNISGSGIEIGASYVVISGNTIDSCAHNGIALTDVQNCVISNNQIFNNGQDPVSAPFAAGIAIFSNTAGPYQPDHIEICNNRIGDRQGTKTQYSAIQMAHYAPGSPITNVRIHDNDFTEQKTTTFDYSTTGVWGTNCYMYNNTDKDGVVQPPFFYATFTTNAGTGDQSITGIGFRPRAIELHATVASTTNVYQCVGTHDSIQGGVIYTSVDGSGRRGGLATGIISIRNSGGTELVAATLVSFDVDGFTFNLSTTTNQADIIAKCYP